MPCELCVTAGETRVVNNRFEFVIYYGYDGGLLALCEALLQSIRSWYGSGGELRGRVENKSR